METTEGNVKANVRQLRQARGWTLKELSRQLGMVGWPMSDKVLNKLETTDAEHARGVGVDDLVALARVFGVKVEELMNPSAIDTRLGYFVDTVATAFDEMDRARLVVSSTEYALEDARRRLANTKADLAGFVDDLRAEVDASGVPFDDFVQVVEEQMEDWHSARLKSALEAVATEEGSNGSGK